MWVMDILCAIPDIGVLESPGSSVNMYREVRGRTITHKFNSVFLLTLLH